MSTRNCDITPPPGPGPASSRCSCPSGLATRAHQLYIRAMPRRASIAIHLLLAAQILLPLHYYACNCDKRDERFAWRMFSPTRVEKCGTQFFVGDDKRPVKISKTFHNAWLGIAQRGRKQVIEAMARRLCKENPEQRVRVRVQCENVPRVSAGRPGLLYDPNREESDDEVEMVSRGLFDFCSTGAL